MKKAILMAILSALILASCGKVEDPTNDSRVTESASATTSAITEATSTEITDEITNTTTTSSEEKKSTTTSKTSTSTKKTTVQATQNNGGNTTRQNTTVNNGNQGENYQSEQTSPPQNIPERSTTTTAKKIVTTTAKPKPVTTTTDMKDYIEGLMEETAKTGAPLIRTMFFEFPEDEKCWNLPEQYMFGSDYLVAPVFALGAREREVYLPKGKWENINDNTVYDGGQAVTVPASLDSMPVFKKIG